MRLVWKFLSEKLVCKIMDSSYGVLILFFICLSITAVGGYTLVYNLSGYSSMDAQKVFGIIVLTIILLVFIVGTIFYAIGSAQLIMSILSKKKISFDEKDAPLDGATRVGETVFQGKEVSLYSKQDKFFLWSRKWQKGFSKYQYYHIRPVDQTEISEVYQVERCCFYCDHIFTQFFIREGKNREKIVELCTIDVQIGNDRDLGFKQVNRGEFEKTVPFKDVEIKEIKKLIDLKQI
ncbi:TPA: hypothetical protein ACG564_000514 [Streptococcus agalactiae]